MKKLLIAMAILVAPAAARAQVTISLGWTAPPPLVEVSPGVQVVEDGNEEIFFVNGRYWVERGGRWYVARDWRTHWVVAARPAPVFLVRHHRGEYLHWRRAEHFRRAEEREVRHERRAEVREMKHERRREEHRRRHD